MRPVAWALLSFLLFYIFSHLPEDWIMWLNNSWNIFGEGPGETAVYWEASFLSYVLIYIYTLIAKPVLTLSLVDLTIWFVSLLIPPTLCHYLSHDTTLTAVLYGYVVPIAFCLLMHYITAPWRRRIAEKNHIEAQKENRNNL